MNLQLAMRKIGAFASVSASTSAMLLLSRMTSLAMA